MNKIFISTSSFGKYDNSPLELCEEKGYEVVLNPHMRKVKPHELVKLARDAVGLIAGTEIITEEILSKLPHLKIISRCGVGVDNIDVDAAKKTGIKVFNTPNVPTLAVAELTVGLILNLLRKVNTMDALIKNGKWDKLMGNLLYGKKVGIIGFGHIGQKVGELLSVFSTELAYYDIEYKSCLINCSYKEFEKILSWAEIVTLHLSISKGKGPIMGNKELNLMKRGTWLVNVSRGGVVHEKALYKALKNGHLAGAALDVFGHEPYKGPLLELDNVILTPHVGSYAKEARIKMETAAMDNLVKGLEAFQNFSPRF